MKFNRIIAAALCAATLANTSELVAWESSEVAQTIFEPTNALDISSKGKDQGFFVIEIPVKEFDALCKEHNFMPEIVVEETEVATEEEVAKEVTFQDYTSTTKNDAWTLVKVAGVIIVAPVVLAAAYLASHIDFVAQWLSLTNTTHPDSLKMCGLDEEDGIFLTSSDPLFKIEKQNAELEIINKPSTQDDFYLVCQPEDEPNVAPEQTEVKENTEQKIVNEPSTQEDTEVKAEAEVEAEVENVCQAPHDDFYLVCQPEDEPKTEKKSMRYGLLGLYDLVFGV